MAYSIVRRSNMSITLEKIFFAEPHLHKHLENPFTKWRNLTRKATEESVSKNTEPLFLQSDTANVTLVLAASAFLLLFAVCGILTIFVLFRKRPKSKVTKEEEEDAESDYYSEVFTDDETCIKSAYEQNQENQKLEKESMPSKLYNKKQFLSALLHTRMASQFVAKLEQKVNGKRCIDSVEI